MRDHASIAESLPLHAQCITLDTRQEMNIQSMVLVSRDYSQSEATVHSEHLFFRLNGPTAAGVSDQIRTSEFYPLILLQSGYADLGAILAPH